MLLSIKALLILILVVMTSQVQAESGLRLATTTSIYNSGLLDYLLPHYFELSDTHVHVISVGTGAALRLAKHGDVDLVMTHAPEAEAEFVDTGYGVLPRVFMYNDFVLVGPAYDPASVSSSTHIVDALTRIAEKKALFVSRGDQSGTHMKELTLWKAAGQTLPFQGYRSVGQGMGRALWLADEMEGYTLVDRGTWLAMQSRLDNRILFQGDKSLHNPYQVILVNPDHHPHTLHAQALAFANWLVAPEAQALIEGFYVDGEQLFFVSAEQSEAAQN